MNPQWTLKTGDRSNIIYKVTCEVCDKYCIGQSKRNIVTWLDEQKRDKKTWLLLLLTVEEEQEKHTFTPNKVHILDQENIRCSGAFLEAWN